MDIFVVEDWQVVALKPRMALNPPKAFAKTLVVTFLEKTQVIVAVDLSLFEGSMAEKNIQIS